MTLTVDERVAQLEAQVADLAQIVASLLPEEPTDPLYARFVSFRERARAAESRLEVPWRTR